MLVDGTVFSKFICYDLSMAGNHFKADRAFFVVCFLFLYCNCDIFFLYCDVVFISMCICQCCWCFSIVQVCQADYEN